MTREEFNSIVSIAYEKATLEAKDIVRDEDTARDIAVSVLANWYEHHTYLEYPTEFAVYYGMRKAARWKAIDRARQDQTANAKPGPEVTVWDMDRLASDDLGPEAIIERDLRALVQERLADLMRVLTDEERKVVQLYFDSRGPIPRLVAKALGLSRFQVQRIFRRAVKKMRLCLRGDLLSEQFSGASERAPTSHE